MAAITLPAPAKINLYLHVTGKREDGYHLLDSLVAFADIGDRLRIEPADRLSLQVEGPFAEHVPLGEDNLILKAARLMAHRAGRPPHFHLTLTKNLPVSAGIGGGSADAAAAVRGLEKLLDIDTPNGDILGRLGADVPSCYICAPLRFEKIGEQVERLTSFPAAPILLANPRLPCPTQAVFKSLALDGYQEKIRLPRLDDQGALYRFLRKTGNDLTDAAVKSVPAIQDVLDALGGTGASLVRMSGSGATCFALFEDETACRQAAAKVAKNNPHWWVQATRLQGAA